MILRQTCSILKNPEPLELVELPDPELGDHDVLIEITACGVCHTELDEIEGRATPTVLPIVLGHQAVGRIIKVGKFVSSRTVGERVGVAWIFSACGHCRFCHAGNNNLCPEYQATGRDVFGGYAERMTVPAKFAFPIPDAFSDFEAAPLLCAGAIGYRSLKLTGIKNGMKLGLMGFGASGHLVLKLVQHKFPDTQVYVFSRTESERLFALELGAGWTGDIHDDTPDKLDAIIDTTPVWKPVVESLKNLAPGGKLVINAIRKEETDKEYLLKLNYPQDLWMEKEIKSVANVASSDVSEFLALAADIPIKPEIQIYRLEEANIALYELKTRKIRGAKVLKIP